MIDIPCPECNGRWSRNFVWDHVRNGCSIGAAEDATQHADHLRLSWAGFTRSATPAELVLAEVVNGAPLPAIEGQPQTVVTRAAAGIPHRVIAGVEAPERNEL